MRFSEHILALIQKAMIYAKEKGYEFITPEIFLLVMIKEKQFEQAFSECGGNCHELEEALINYAEQYLEGNGKSDPAFSSAFNEMIIFAQQSAHSSGNKEVCIRHIVNSLWSLVDCYAVYYMEIQGVSKADMLRELTEIDEYNEQTRKSGKSENSDVSHDSLTEEFEDSDDFEMNEFDIEDEDELPFATASGEWKLYAPCLNDTIEGKSPLIGRENELDRTIQILCRKEKNNPLHLGEPGVGKTAITYGLVRKLVNNDVPDSLKGAKVFSLDLGGMLAGTQYRGDFEKRFKKVLNEIAKEDKPIIYIDEIHNLSGAGAVGESSLDASNMLKPYLTDGHIRFIGATTYEEYKKYFEKNKSLVRRFQNVEVKEPSQEETILILEGLKRDYEKFHGVKYAKGVIEYAVSMSAKYIHERFLPDKAIDLLDESGAYRKLHPTDKKTQTVDKSVVNEVLTTICRVPVETVDTDDVSGLKELQKKMLGNIFGQDEAVAQVVNAVKYSKAGLSEENKPLASLLFVGPTGVGKTEIAKTLAKELGVKLIRFDMSEYGEKHAVAKLIGSPAGYVGYEEGGLLTEEIRKHPSAVLLLDEIEKAHSDIYNILLQVMDYATLTDNQGRKADFRNVVVIMTSNAGANRLGKNSIGFNLSNPDNGLIMSAVKDTFQPEFRNRLSKIVVFNSMDEKMAGMVVDKKLKELAAQLAAKKTVLTVDASAKELVRKNGISREFGAREVDRVIRNDIKPLFVDELLFGKLKKGGAVELSASNGSFTVKIKSK